MASRNQRSARLRSVSGLAALVIVCSGVGTVYATTNAQPVSTAGSSTGTKTSTATGTGTTSGPARDRNGVVITQKPGSSQVQGFSKEGKRLYGTVIPTSAKASTIAKKFKNKAGKVKKVKRALLVRGKKVGTFSIDKYGHLKFSTAKAQKKGTRALVKLRFTSRVKNAHGKWVKKKLVIRATTPFTW